MSNRWAIVAAGVLGAIAVALGAFAAHGLPDTLAESGYPPAEVAKRVDNLQTGARYQTAAALALLAIGLAAPARPAWRVAAALLTAGAVVFGGLLYALAFLGPDWRWLGAVVPLGGAALIAGWVTVAIAGFRSTARSVEGGDDGGDETARELIRLEEVLSHQQRTLQDLDEVITAVRDDADRHGRSLETHEATLRRLVEGQRAAEPMPPDERPPHY